MRNTGRLVALVGMLVGAAAPAFAHHAFSAEFDQSKPVKMSGEITKLEWTNPHAFIYLEVKDEKAGKMVEWEIELMSLNHLRSYGWTSKTVKVGEVLSATGAPAKSGAPSMIANRIKLPDGREIRS